MITMKIYSDYTCPFCYVGQAVVKRLKDNFPIEDKWFGLELHPETPPEGDLISELYDPEMLEMVFQGLERSGSEYGLKFNWPERRFNTRLSLKLSEYAKQSGHFKALHSRLFKAYFEEEKDISDRDVLIGLVGEIGLARAEVENALDDPTWDKRLQEVRQAAVEQKVRSLPTFIINDEHRIIGLQPYKKFEDLLRRLEQEFFVVNGQA